MNVQTVLRPLTRAEIPGIVELTHLKSKHWHAPAKVNGRLTVVIHCRSCESLFEWDENADSSACPTCLTERTEKTERTPGPQLTRTPALI